MLKVGQMSDQMHFTTSLITISAFLIFFSVCTFCTGLLSFKEQRNLIIAAVYLLGALVSIILGIMASPSDMYSFKALLYYSARS